MATTLNGLATLVEGAVAVVDEDVELTVELLELETLEELAIGVLGDED